MIFKLNTISVLQSTGVGEYASCKEAFLFSMVNPHGLGPTKMPLVRRQGYAMYSDSSLGPTFGGGHDLHMAENACKHDYFILQSPGIFVRVSSGTERDILNGGSEFYCDKLRGLWIQLVTIYNLQDQ